jgi:hypothetical protein
MPQFREVIKRAMPGFVRDAVVRARAKLSAPPLEDIVLHEYEFVPEFDTKPRLSLVIPSISPRTAFGGVITGIDIFLDIGKRTGAELRILLDDFDRADDASVLQKCAAGAGLDATKIQIVPRQAWVPQVGVRASDVFYSFNWWTTLNIRPLLLEQSRIFGGRPKPYIYVIQEYEPLFYPMSSTHMMARAAFEARWPCWGVFNSGELYDFFEAQQHRVERAFVFEPKMLTQLRPLLGGPAPKKKKRILVYGRPSVDRNCYPAVEKGLRRWAARYPEFSGWEVVSAGLPHKPMPFAPGRAMRSMGKLPLEEYGQSLRTTAVGLSLMASPHPSYPPLEMAHFGLQTVTNTYANKNLSTSHPNILSIGDVLPDTVADALARACQKFEAEPEAGWLATSDRASFIEPGPFEFLDELSNALLREIWIPD